MYEKDSNISICVFYEKSQKNSAEVRKKFNQLNTKAIRPYFFRTVFFAVLLHSTHSFALLQNKKSTTVKY